MGRLTLAEDSMELCTICRKPILKPDLEWHAVETCRATFSSPAEYDEQPFHRECWERPDDDNHDAVWARHLLRNTDARDCS